MMMTFKYRMLLRYYSQWLYDDDDDDDDDFQIQGVTAILQSMDI